MAESSTAEGGKTSERKRLAWDQGKSKESLDAFLEKYPPSSTKKPVGGDGWIWVHSNRGSTGKHNQDAVAEEGRKLVEDLMHKIEEIESNPKIPKVKSKKAGPSKKMVRESAVERCESQLRALGKRHSSGKWMFFEKPDYVDRVYDKLARSIIDGPLSKLEKARCNIVKVATCDEVQREGTHLICLYLDDMWDKDGAKEVLECVVKNHGEIPRSSKSDLYTLIGIDSSHPSKIRSALFRPSELFTMEQMKEWQQQFRNERNAKSRKISRTEDESDFASTSTSTKPIKADDFWPMEKEEKDKKPADTPEENPVASIAARTSADKGSKGDLSEDSETEDEEDLLAPGKASPTKGTDPSSSSAEPAALPAKDEIASPSAAPRPSEEKENKREEKPSDDEIKVTTARQAVAGRKRDRFGRSDF